MPPRPLSPIGGVFAPETPYGDAAPHPDALALSTGRACLAVMLQTLRPQAVYVPFYTCNSVYQPFVERRIPLRFYALDARLRPQAPPTLQTDEYFLWTNYFGVGGRDLADIAARYGDRLLIDDTHAFFAGRREGLWSFNSARKFFGVPDGAYLFAPTPLTVAAPRFSPAPSRHAHLARAGDWAAAYQAEAAYEATLDAVVRRISRVGERLLRGVDFARAAQIRRENFAVLHTHLAATNRLALDPAPTDIPFCYPYLPTAAIDRGALAQRQIFALPLWQDVIWRAVEGYAWERQLSRRLLALPIDPRYGPVQMHRLVATIMDLANRPQP